MTPHLPPATGYGLLPETPDPSTRDSVHEPGPNTLRISQHPAATALEVHRVDTAASITPLCDRVLFRITAVQALVCAFVWLAVAQAGGQAGERAHRRTGPARPAARQRRAVGRLPVPPRQPAAAEGLRNQQRRRLPEGRAASRRAGDDARHHHAERRSVRAARRRHHPRLDRRVPELRSVLPQRLLAVARRHLRSRALSARRIAGRARSRTRAW